VDRDVRYLVPGIDVNARDVRILVEAILDAGDAGFAGEMAGWDRQRRERMAAGIVR
jgi:hypothetical protein